MLLLSISLPFFGGLFLFFMDVQKRKKQEITTIPQHSHDISSNQGLASLILLATGLLVGTLPFYHEGSVQLGYFPFGVQFSLFIDGISVLFSVLIVVIWLIVFQYATVYMAHDAQKNRFYASYVSLLGAMLGLCYAENLMTFYLFFELVSLCCVTLVVQEQTESAILACKKFFYYSMAGAFLAMVSVFYFTSTLLRSGLSDAFVAGGITQLWAIASPPSIIGFTCLAFVGFGCKAGMFPLHGWLKTAHPIAPAPASAVLSAITTKAGVLAIIRLLYYVVGPDHLKGSSFQQFGLSLAILTIFMGSMLAYREHVLKTRLAYSTVSQVSYVLFGLLLFHPYGFVGALLQVLFHALAKTLLFLCAGTMIHETGLKKVEDFQGIGRQLPMTFLLFTLASLSLVGLPFTGGFVSKWYLSIGATSESGLGFLGMLTIMTSALLTAGYLLPICVQGFYSEKNKLKLKQTPFKGEYVTYWLAFFLVILGTFPSSLIEILLTLATTLGLGGGL